MPSGFYAASQKIEREQRWTSEYNAASPSRQQEMMREYQQGAEQDRKIERAVYKGLKLLGKGAAGIATRIDWNRFDWGD